VSKVAYKGELCDCGNCTRASIPIGGDLYVCPDCANNIGLEEIEKKISYQELQEYEPFIAGEVTLSPHLNLL